MWNLLEISVIISFYRKRLSNTGMYYSMDGDLVYCNNNQELMEELQLEHTPEQWRLFTNSPKVSLKAVLLHRGNMFPSIPLAHTIHKKERYENHQVLLQKNMLWRTSVEYMCWPESHSNAKLQGGNTKFCCCLCERESQGRDCHYRIKKWPLCSEVTPGQKKVAHPALMGKSNIYLPQHIKLGLKKHKWSDG